MDISVDFDFDELAMWWKAILLAQNKAIEKEDVEAIEFYKMWLKDLGDTVADPAEDEDED